jgi:hypothetical protein
VMRSICYLGIVAVLAIAGCRKGPPPYGVEQPLFLPGEVRQTWAVAPVINLSGQRAADPILQADLLYQQLQKVAGLNVVPVDRVVEVYLALGIDQVQSEEQAAIVCSVLGADALVVATITAYDPYDPPKQGASLHLLRVAPVQRPDVDPRELARRAAPSPDESLPARPSFVQVVGMFDAANGSVRAKVEQYARGRSDPTSPYAGQLYLVEMDRYSGFVYHTLIDELLGKLAVVN